MRAYQNVAMYCQLPGQERKKQMKAHKKRMKAIKGVLTNNDLKIESTHSPRNNQDSSKISALRYGNDAMIARNNLVLAKRIFEIMEGPGIISDLLESDPTTSHPGTINFPHRLAEAKRIHNENLIIASRLDAVQPTYYDKSAVTAVRKASPTKGKRPQPSRPTQQGQGQQGQGGGGGGGGGELAQHSSVVEGSRSEDKPPKSKNVLLEYTKIQKGRVLDVAVIKEPFRDSYSIFGIDIDNGQRYELKLSSEEVSTALEGDILVTSVDNVEVWMALISKVELSPVEAFSKTPLPNAAHTHNNHHGQSHSESKKPTKPTTLNSSKNQSTNNPRKMKLLKKGGEQAQTQNAPPTSRGRVNTAGGGSSVGSSSAVNNGTVDDDFSLTTGGDESQQNDRDNENDLHFGGEGGGGDGGGGEGGGYTLDEYYEDHAPLSPLPSQTGFITSAPSGRQRVSTGGAAGGGAGRGYSGGKGLPNTTPTPPSATSKQTLSGSDIRHNHNREEGVSSDDNSSSGPCTAATAVKYIVDTAVKNVLMLHVQAPQAVSRKDGEDNRSASASASAKPKATTDKPSSSAKTTAVNPYTSTTFTVVSASPRSHSIMYKPAGAGAGAPGSKEKAGAAAFAAGAAAGGGGAGTEQSGGGGGGGGDKSRSPTTPTKTSRTRTPGATDAKEPQKPKESAPIGQHRRASHKPRQSVDTGGGNNNSSKRKPSSSVANHAEDHGRRKKSNMVQGGQEQEQGEARRKSTMFRKPVDPMAAVTALAPKVAGLGVKTALKRVAGIVELFDIDVSL